MTARIPVLLAFSLVGCSFFSAARARADMVLTVDGKWRPVDDKAPALSADEDPPGDVIQSSAEAKLDAGYDTVKLSRGGFSTSAGLVSKLVLAERNEAYIQALNNASSNFFEDAADGFLAASNEMQGFGKQIALYSRVQAYQSMGDSTKALAAADELLAAFPKSYWFCDVYLLKARVAATKNSEDAADDVTKLLATITSAPGMNNRDLFRAEWTRIFLTLETRRKFDEAEKAYRDLVAKIEKTDAVQGAVVRQQALVGVGNCLVQGKKEAEARGFFEKATESRNTDVLAGAYLGLGNVALSEAKALRDADKRAEAKAKLEEAVTQYLRVTVHYKLLGVDDDSPVLEALARQAKVFVALFEMSGNKDCESADRAWKTYRELVDALPAGAAKSGYIKEYKAFDEKKKAACSVPAPAGTDKPAEPAGMDK